MPDHLKALVVILGLATLVFAFARAPACALANAPADFARRRNLWFAVTLIAFLSHQFWIYIALAGLLLVYAQRFEWNRLALFFLLLFALPRVSAFISGGGVIETLFSIDYQRLLVLAVLLPAALALRAQRDTEPLGRPLADKFALGYLLLTPALMLTYSSLTVTFRHGVFNPFVDVFLPYYVASRALKDLQAFRDALAAFVIAALVLSATLLVEFLRHWLLYASLDEALRVSWAWASYTGRGGNLRAQGPIGNPIAAGYVVTVAIALFLYVRTLVPNARARHLGLALLAAGLIAPLSRGPWLGAAAMLLVFILMGQAPGRALVKAGLAAAVAAPLLMMTSFGETVVDYLPFVGTLEAENVTFRQRLADASIQVILENPIFGRYDYLESPAMQALKGADNLIDTVNTYAVVGLSSGLIGLSLFVGFFAVSLAGIFQAIRSVPDHGDERHLLGRALLAALAGALVIIGTVSPVLLIPTVAWVVGGLGVGYARLVRVAGASGAARTPASGPGTARVAARGMPFGG